MAGRILLDKPKYYTDAKPRKLSSTRFDQANQRNTGKYRKKVREEKTSESEKARPLCLDELSRSEIETRVLTAFWCIGPLPHVPCLSLWL